MKRLLTGLLLSFTEGGRISPRLTTVFAFSAAALWLLYRGSTVPATVVGGIVLSPWPPEYIWSGLCLLIAGLLGLGKVVDSWKTVRLEGPPPGATTIVAETAPVSADTANITTNAPSAPAE